MAEMEPRALLDHEKRTDIPEVKQRAILALFDAILFSDGDEAGRIMASLRGRRGRRVTLTFGELRTLADDKKITAAAASIGIDDLGAGPPIDLAKALAFVSVPSLPICEACGKYAVTVDGGEVISLYQPGHEIRCPHCNEGLLTQPEQAQAFRAWTSGLEVAPHTEYDREALGHMALPLTSERILADAGDWYQIHPWINDACREVSLMDGEVPNLAHLCGYLWHVERRRFSSPDQVLEALGNPASLSARDRLSMTAILRQAKAWTPSAPVPSPAPTSPPPASVPTIKLTGSSPHAHLSDLFQHLFTTDEMRMFVTNQYGRSLSGAVPWGGSSYVVAGNLTTALQNRGLIDQNLFEKLRQARPGQSDNINQVAQACGHMVR